MAVITGIEDGAHEASSMGIVMVYARQMAFIT